MGCTLCEHCTAACCHYLALPIDLPETRRDFDDLRWYLMHDGVIVFVEEGDWYVQVRTKCRNLRADYKCGIYDTRPTICRTYKAEDCDYVGGEYQYEHVFTEPEQIVAFAAKHFTDQRATAARKTRRQQRRSIRARATADV